MEDGSWMRLEKFVKSSRDKPVKEGHQRYDHASLISGFQDFGEAFREFLYFF